MAIGAPIKNSIHSIHSILGIHSKRRPVDIANYNGYTEIECKDLPQRYAVITVARHKEPAAGGFLRGRSHLKRGSNVAPLPAFFCQAFFSTEKKAVRRRRGRRRRCGWGEP